MAKYPYRSLGAFFDRIFRNALNDNFKDIESDIKDLDKRVDGIITGSGGDSILEVADARLELDGTEHDTLKDHMDAIHEAIDGKADDAAVSTKIDNINEIRVNVRELGLAPDAGVDISDALQDIIDFNPLSSNKLFFENGRYMISRPIMLRSNLDILFSEKAEIYLMDNSKCRMFDTDKTKTFENITIKGGIFNGNDYGQGVQSVSGNWDFSNSMRFYNVKNLKVTDVLVKEVRGHGIEHWNCDGFLFQNIEFDQGHDEINRPTGGSRRDGITGGSSNGKYINIHGFTNDDMVAIISGVSWGGVYVDEVKNLEINGIRGGTKYFPAYDKTMKTWTAIRIACADGKYTKNVKVSDISGSFNSVPYPIRLGGYDIFRDGFLENIHISNVHDLDFVSSAEEQAVIFMEKGTCKNVTVDGIKYSGVGQYRTPLFATNNGKINKLNLRNVKYDYTTSPVSSGVSMLIKDRQDDASYPSFIEEINLYNIDYADNTSMNLYKKVSTLTIDGTTPKTLIKGSFITRNTYNSIGGDTTTVSVDSEFVYQDVSTLLNQQTGYRNLYDGTIYTFLRGGFVPISYKQPTVTGFYSFKPVDNYVFVDVSAATQYYRIQDDVTRKFPIGYTLNIIRVDSNAVYTPYIRMTNDVPLDGNISTNLPIGAKLRIQYDGSVWRTVDSQTDRKGTLTYNGDGTSASKTIPHNLITTPSVFNVQAASSDAGTAGIKYVTADATNLTVYFNAAPISGTNNVTLKWRASL